MNQLGLPCEWKTIGNDTKQITFYVLCSKN